MMVDGKEMALKILTRGAKYTQVEFGINNAHQHTIIIDRNRLLIAKAHPNSAIQPQFTGYKRVIHNFSYRDNQKDYTST